MFVTDSQVPSDGQVQNAIETVVRSAVYEAERGITHPIPVRDFSEFPQPLRRAAAEMLFHAAHDVLLGSDIKDRDVTWRDILVEHLSWKGTGLRREGRTLTLELTELEAAMHFGELPTPQAGETQDAANERIIRELRRCRQSALDEGAMVGGVIVGLAVDDETPLGNWARANKDRLGDR